mgnify:CR=1 FL=1
MRPTGPIASSGDSMMNKRLSPLDGLFDDRPNAKASPIGNMQQYESADAPSEGAMSALNQMQQSDEMQQDPQQPQADPYSELNRMLESPEGDMMQDYMEEQRQQKAKNSYLFR